MRLDEYDLETLTNDFTYTQETTVIIYIIIVVMAIVYIIPFAMWAPDLLNRRTKFCCFVRPWCAHFIDDSDMGEYDGWAGMFFCVTDSSVQEYRLSKLLAHEVRHVLHGIILGVLYDVMYSNFKVFEHWAERDCERAERNPVYCKKKHSHLVGRGEEKERKQTPAQEKP